MATATTSSAAGPRAAIVDHLALTQPNPAFTQTATELLEQAGYAVDYFPGEQVTVELYRDLPTWGHELIIFRVHSALGRVGDRPADWVTLFTSESYDKTSYRKDQTKQRLSKVSYYESGPEYFGVMPGFIKSSTKGDFQGATIIIMGCDGLRSDAMAEAFVQKRGKGRCGLGWPGLTRAHGRRHRTPAPASTEGRTRAARGGSTNHDRAWARPVIRERSSTLPSRRACVRHPVGGLPLLGRSSPQSTNEGRRAAPIFSRIKSSQNSRSCLDNNIIRGIISVRRAERST